MKNQNRVTLDSDGYFQIDRKRFVPVGVNYWPASCGAEMWSRWPATEICRDLDLMVRLGLNSVRCCLRWADFEPELGEYRVEAFHRLRPFLGWCRERHLFVLPTLFAGPLAGRDSWPKGGEGRNLFSDPIMRERAAALGAHVAHALAPFAETLLGVDLGNPVSLAGDAAKAAAEEIRLWSEQVSTAIRRRCPGCVVVAGAAPQLGTGFDLLPMGDCAGVQGHPVPAWHPIGFDGLTDPLCHSLVPFYVKCARACGPALLNEISPVFTTALGEEQQDSFLCGILPGCWEAGANGFFWGGWRDIPDQPASGAKRGFEGGLGLVGGDDKVKPGLSYFSEFLAKARDRRTPAVPNGSGCAGLYWSRKTGSESRGERQAELARMIIAHHFLEKLGRGVRIVRGDQPLPDRQDVGVIWVAGASLDAEEIARLRDWAAGGGVIVWQGPHPLGFGTELGALFGVEPVDLRYGARIVARAFEHEWHFTNHPAGIRLQVEVTTARVLATDAEGRAVAVLNEIGRGKAAAVFPLVDGEVAGMAGDREARDRWLRWYGGLLQVAETPETENVKASVNTSAQ